MLGIFVYKAGENYDSSKGNASIQIKSKNADGTYNCKTRYYSGNGDTDYDEVIFTKEEIDSFIRCN